MGYDSYYDSMIEEDIFVSNKPGRKKRERSIEDITNDVVKLFIRENKDGLLIELVNAYNLFIEDTGEYSVLKSVIDKLKDKFNVLVLDVYHEHSNINTTMKESYYIRTANLCLNDTLKKRYLTLVKS